MSNLTNTRLSGFFGGGGGGGTPTTNTLQQVTDEGNVDNQGTNMILTNITSGVENRLEYVLNDPTRVYIKGSRIDGTSKGVFEINDWLNKFETYEDNNLTSACNLVAGYIQWVNSSGNIIILKPSEIGIASVLVDLPSDSAGGFLALNELPPTIIDTSNPQAINTKESVSYFVFSSDFFTSGGFNFSDGTIAEGVTMMFNVPIGYPDGFYFIDTGGVDTIIGFPPSGVTSGFTTIVCKLGGKYYFNTFYK
jgi:hypothetical protein